MKKILITIFTLLSLVNNAQVCFTYDNAGNQVKRQTYVLAITNQENDELSQVSPEFSTERRSLSEGDDLSELVMYLNPTSSAFRLRDQYIWIGSSLRVVTNEGKIVTNRHLTAAGETPQENNYYTKERISNINEVGSDAKNYNLEFDVDIPIGFEGDLTIKDYASPASGETFFVESNGIDVFSTSKGTRIDFKIPSGNKNIKWGIRNPNPGGSFSNSTQPVSGNIDTGLHLPTVNVNSSSSFIRISGNHRAWAGFLFWK